MSETFQHPAPRRDQPPPGPAQERLLPTRRMATVAILSAGAFTASSLGLSLTAFSAQATLEDVRAGAPSPAVLPYDVLLVVYAVAGLVALVATGSGCGGSGPTRW